MGSTEILGPRKRKGLFDPSKSLLRLGEGEAQVKFLFQTPISHGKLVPSVQEKGLFSRWHQNAKSESLRVRAMQGQTPKEWHSL